MDTGALLLGLVLGIVLTAFLVAIVAMARAGSVGRAFWGLTIAGRAKNDPDFAAKLDALLGTAAATPTPSTPTAPPPPPKPSGEPLRLLALLQAEARLVDFLMEDISGANDTQVGQAVRDIHTKAQQTLKQHLTIETVLGGQEGEQVTIPPGFDPAAIRVVGNVTGHPPFTGEIQHPGWKVRQMTLPTTAPGQDLMILQPAEVQLP